MRACSAGERGEEGVDIVMCVCVCLDDTVEERCRGEMRDTEAEM